MKNHFISLSLVIIWHFAGALSFGCYRNSDDEDTAALIAKLRDKDSSVRVSAAKEIALGHANPNTPVQPLIEALQDDKEKVRYWVAWALNHRIGSPAALSLRKAIEDKNSRIRSGGIL